MLSSKHTLYTLDEDSLRSDSIPYIVLSLQCGKNVILNVVYQGIYRWLWCSGKSVTVNVMVVGRFSFGGMIYLLIFLSFRFCNKEKLRHTMLLVHSKLKILVDME